MFVLYHKESGCVVMKSTEHPLEAPVDLIDNIGENFGILEVPYTVDEISGMVCKVVDDQCEIIGPLSETTFSDCPACPDWQK